MKLIHLICKALLIAILLAVPTLSFSQNWSYWYEVPDGEDNGISIAYSRGNFEYDGNTYMHRIKVHNGYPNTVTFTLQLLIVDDKGIERYTTQDFYRMSFNEINASAGLHWIVREIKGWRITKIKAES